MVIQRNFHPAYRECAFNLCKWAEHLPKKDHVLTGHEANFNKYLKIHITDNIF